ncbi:MAG: hypothetical protein IJT32_04110, partial [Lachnospiraceae bacterium]|nr:hypothetical protein [Lachnospiraceae bacterium]
KPHLDAGVRPTDFLKNEYLGQTGTLPQVQPVSVQPQAVRPTQPAEPMVPVEHTQSLKAAGVARPAIQPEMVPSKPIRQEQPIRQPRHVEVQTAEQKALHSGDTFRIPRVAPAGDVEGVGLEIPVVNASGAPAMFADTAMAGAGAAKAAGAITKGAAQAIPEQRWEPQALTGDTRRLGKSDVTKIVAGANDILQKTLEQYGDDASVAHQIKIEPPREVDTSALAASVSAILDGNEAQPEPVKQASPQEEAVLQQTRRTAPSNAFVDENERKAESELDEMLAKAKDGSVKSVSQDTAQMGTAPHRTAPVTT